MAYQCCNGVLIAISYYNFLESARLAGIVSMSLSVSVHPSVLVIMKLSQA